MAKQLNARIQTKHDTEQNWQQAASFIPKAGEFIIYDAQRNEEELNAAKEAYLKENDLQTRTAYEALLAKAVPRVKVGTGDLFLPKLPFLTDPYVLKIDGKDLSDNNFDDAAKAIIDEAKAAKEKDILQFTDTTYKPGLGMGIVNDTDNPPSEAYNYIHNGGVLGIQEATDNGYLNFTTGDGKGGRISSKVYIHGINTAAFESKSSFATSNQGALAQKSLQSIYTKPEEEEKKNLYFSDGNGDEFVVTLPLGELAFQNTINYNQISEYLSTFTGATDTSNGQMGLVPAPRMGQENFVLSGNGDWKDIGQVTFNPGNGLAYYNERLENMGLLAVYQENTDLVFVQLSQNEEGNVVEGFTKFPLGAGISWESTLTSGEKIGTLTIDGTTNILYAPAAVDRVSTSGGTMTGDLVVQADITSTGTITGNKVVGAVWNDYAEFRSAETTKPGLCVYDTPAGTMRLTNSRLLPACRIISDTYGFAIGENSNSKTPTAVSGRALVYTDGDVSIGDCLCSGENGKLSKMTREEIKEYPDRIVGIVSEIPTYETWGENNVLVDGRVWIYVR